MELKDAKCPNCGANIKVDQTKDAAICEFCGSAFVVSKAIQNFYTSNVTNNYINADKVNVFDGLKERLEKSLQYYQNKESLSDSDLRQEKAVVDEYIQTFPFYSFGYQAKLNYFCQKIQRLENGTHKQDNRQEYLDVLQAYSSSFETMKKETEDAYGSLLSAEANPEIQSHALTQKNQIERVLEEQQEIISKKELLLDEMSAPLPFRKNIMLKDPAQLTATIIFFIIFGFCFLGFALSGISTVASHSTSTGGFPIPVIFWILALVNVIGFVLFTIIHNARKKKPDAPNEETNEETTNVDFSLTRQQRIVHLVQDTVTFAEIQAFFFE